MQWISPAWSATSGVQVNECRIDDVVNAHFSNGPPVRIPFPVTVIVFDKVYKPTDHLGAFD